MRIAVTTALMMVAAIAWADEPTPPDTKTEAAAEQATATEQTSEQAAEQATEATEQATEQASEATAAAADEAKADDKPFKVPAGYRSKRVNGKTMYCSSNVTSGSRVGKEKCRTEQQLREIQRQREAAPTQQTQANCGGAVCAKN